MFPIDIDFSRLKEVLTYDPQAPMIFSSGIFLWLFAAFMVVYVLLQRKYTARIMFVTLFSYYFTIRVAAPIFSACHSHRCRLLPCATYGSCRGLLET